MFLPPSTQRWEKLGRIPIELDPAQSLDAYAAVPFLDRIDDRRYWLYFSGRDHANRSHTRRTVIE